MPQLTKSSRRTEEIPITIIRGDDVEFPFEHQMGTSSTIQQVRFEAKETNTGDTKISIAYDEVPLQFDLSTENQCTIQIEHDDTVGLSTSTNYKYAVEMVSTGGEYHTPVFGTLTLTDDVVDDGASSPSASWQTRSELTTTIATLETEIETLTAIFAVSTIASAASSGASSIVLESAAFLTAADTITVQTDSGYENHTVLSVVSNTVNLDGTTLGDDAAVGNAVRKVV